MKKRPPREPYQRPKVVRVRIVPGEMAVTGCKMRTEQTGPTVGLLSWRTAEPSAASKRLASSAHDRVAEVSFLEFRERAGIDAGASRSKARSRPPTAAT